jgi:hypothetical protein
LEGQQETLNQASTPFPGILAGKTFKIFAIYFPNAGSHRMVWWKVQHNAKFFSQIGPHSDNEYGFVCAFFPLKYCEPGDYFFKFQGTEEDIEAAIKIALEEDQRRRRFISRRLPLLMIRTPLSFQRRL